MLNHRSAKLKGAIFNIAFNEVDITNDLPRGANGLILLQLKRNLSYDSHVYFETIRPGSLYQTLTILKENNVLYKDVDIAVNVPHDLLSFSDDDNNDEENKTPESLEDSYRFNS